MDDGFVLAVRSLVSNVTWQGEDTKITSMHTSAELDLSAGVGRSHSVRLFSADPMSAYYHIADAQSKRPAVPS